MGDQTRELVFLLLGNNPSLPFSECKSILESNNVLFREIKRLDQVLVVSAPIGACRVVARQAGMVRRACILLTQSNKTRRDIINAISNLDLKETLRTQTSFAVRVKGVKGHSRDLNTNELEKEIGAKIREKVKWAKVDLERPDVLFFTVVTNDVALFCLSVEEIDDRGFGERRPGLRPFFHPSSMHPRLARAMVNLSGARLSSRFLDPFCGSGGILLEAEMIGCESIGEDIDPAMCQGSKENLRALGIQSPNVCVADARKIPLKEVDAIATDPPYGRSSSTMGSQTFALVEESLREMTSILRLHGKICISLPSDLDVRKFKLEGLRILETHPFRVHRSLTRNVVTLLRS
jgi:tRNA (guanine10-N2)-dimethyltransferase